MGFRDFYLELLPPWLRDDYGEAWGRAHGDVKDGGTALLKERVAARMPVRPGTTSLAPYAPTGALESLGRDRRMRRAVGESDASYAQRLADAWTIWQSGGTPLGVLRALAAAGYPEAKLVVRSQRMYSLDADRNLVVTHLPSGSWCYEPEPQPFWSRYSILFSSDALPPAWLTGAYVFGPVVPETTSGAAAPSFAFTGTHTLGQCRIRVEVLDPSPDYTYSWFMDDVEQQAGVPMFPGGTTGPVPLVLANGTPSGLTVEWAEGDPYGSGNAWFVDVQPDAEVPDEDSLEMNVIRALTVEWSNAAAVFDGIIIATVGGCWGYPLGTWGEPGDFWGGDAVLNYHP